MGLEDNLEPPTLSEVVRLLRDQSRKLDNLGQNFVGRQEYEANQRGTGERFAHTDQDIADVVADLATHKTEYKKDQESARERSSRLLLLVAGAFVTGIVGIIFAFISRGVGLQ